MFDILIISEDKTKISLLETDIKDNMDNFSRLSEYLRKSLWGIEDEIHLKRGGDKDRSLQKEN